jgi:transcription initiation factor TFIIH subunit 2
MSSFSHLIRFQADDGKTYYGDLTKETPTREIEGSQVEVLEGDVISGFKKSGGKAKVEKLLCPLPTTNIVLCVGLNYRQHAEECNVSFLKSNYQLSRLDIRIVMMNRTHC